MSFHCHDKRRILTWLLCFSYGNHHRAIIHKNRTHPNTSYLSTINFNISQKFARWFAVARWLHQKRRRKETAPVFQQNCFALHGKPWFARWCRWWQGRLYSVLLGWTDCSRQDRYDLLGEYQSSSFEPQDSIRCDWCILWRHFTKRNLALRWSLRLLTWCI